MWYKIKQGRHRAYPLSLGIHFGKTSESYEVIFDDSCRYQLEGVDQLDWNKLVGWSYGFIPKLQLAYPYSMKDNYGEGAELIMPHHQNSIRFAWRYNLKKDKIEISKYVYLEDERVSSEIVHQELEFNKKYIIELEASDYRLDSRWGYNLGMYFGGNNPAPHNLKIWLKKL